MVVGVQGADLLPPQATMAPVRAISSISAASIVRHLRRFGAMPKRNTHASTAPPFAYQGIPAGGWLDAVQGVVWLAVVAMVSVVVTALAEEMVTGLVVNVSVGVCAAPDGLATVPVNVTLPVKPLVGVMVMVDVLLVVAPAVSVTAAPETVKPGPAETVTVFVPVLAL